MADIRRPDIQVLEDRIKRIKSQIAEYKGLKVYSSTQKRLAAVRDDLAFCLTQLDNILCCNESSAKPVDLVSGVFKVLLESDKLGDLDNNLQTFEDDLNDVFSISISGQADSYPPKTIVSNYHKRLMTCAIEPSGILQFNQFCQDLSSWFEARFSSDSCNSNFKYRADRIHEWIDLFIIAAGSALHDMTFAAFRSELSDWLAKLQTEEDWNWVVPEGVMRFQKYKASDCTKEAILLERIVKSTLYDDSFYPSLRDSIAQIVIKSGRFSAEELRTDSILADCKRFLVVTSSFDPEKYQEVSDV